MILGILCKFILSFFISPSIQSKKEHKYISEIFYLFLVEKLVFEYYNLNERATRFFACVSQALTKMAGSLQSCRAVTIYVDSV